MSKGLSIALAIIISGLAGCSKEAEEKCNQFEAAFCQRIVDCTKTLASPTSMESCIADFSKRADCSNAVEVPSDFDKCIPAINALACSKLASIPDSCNIKLSE
jgi:hypothetical protein